MNYISYSISFIPSISFHPSTAPTTSEVWGSTEALVSWGQYRACVGLARKVTCMSWDLTMDLTMNYGSIFA